MSTGSKATPTTKSQSTAARYLQRRLLITRPGQALPGVRQIMSECGVGQAAVSRALEELQAQGVVTSSPRRGVFRTDQPVHMADVVQTLDVIYCKPQQKLREDRFFHAELLQEIGWQCGQRRQSVRHFHPPRDAELSAFEEIAEHTHCRACLVVGAARADLIDRVFGPRDVPVVNLLPESAEVPPQSVLIDPEQVVKAQLSHLLELGHERIGYLHQIESGIYHRDLVLRREQFYRMMAERALPVLPHWMQFGGYTPEEAAEVMQRMLASEPRPTAAIVADRHLPACYQVLARNGLVPGRDFSLVGTDDLPLTKVLWPQATSLRIDRAEAVEIALDMLDRLVCHQPVKQVRFVVPRIAVRASTGPCRNYPWAP